MPFDSDISGFSVLIGHQPIKDNGVKLVDPRGEMLESSWEIHATIFSNAATTEDFLTALNAFIETAKIDISKPARVVYARDTRPSGPALVSAFEDGLKAIGAEGRDAGVTTTPILHYLVRSINTRGTKYAYGDDSEHGYFTKLSEAFKKLVVSSITTSAIPSDLLIDSGWATYI
jgi:phosphoacetylglucosamine mutase